MKLPLLTASILSVLGSAQAFASTVSGNITDEKGKPVSGAEVRVEGSKVFTYTDQNGNYVLQDIKNPHIHLHVYSDAHIHGDKDLGDVTEDNLTVDFTLKASSVENIIVTATAMHSSVLESVTPVSVIGQEELKKVQQATLGETLKSTPGVHSSYFGPVSSSPVIRGNDGPRVKIVQNSLDVSDVSRVGPDHNVATNTSSATQVEVLRGPATLQYGSGAIGGVVNVVDKRIPQSVPEEVEGEAQLQYSTVDNGKFANIDVTGGSGKIAYHFDGYKRKTDDIDIPGYAEAEPDGDEGPGTLENSAIDTTDLTAGLSYVGDEGFFGFSVEKLDNLYGVPGHSHEHEEEEEEHEEEEHEEEAGTSLDVDMTRYQIAGEWYSPFKGISTIKMAAAHTNYEHVELEGDEIGTKFKNDSTDFRLTANHEDFGGWHGVIGVQANQGEYEAEGEEAFSPNTDSDMLALFLVEQKKFGDVTVEFGGRIERNTYDADGMSIDLHVEHEEEEDHDHEEEDHEEHTLNFDFDEYSFTNVSYSAGFNWEYTPGYSVAMTLSHSERGPSQQELLSAGTHVATQTFELGLVYDLDEDGEISETLNSVEEEVSNNLDITFRKYTGDWGYTVSAFYNQADNYIYESNTGLITAEEEHDEEEAAEEEEHEHSAAGLPVYYFQQSDADIYGLEAETFVDVNPNWRVTLYGDYVRAKLENQDLPRTPPLRVGSKVNYTEGNWSSELGVVWYDEQTKVAPTETTTDGYTLVNANIQYEANAAGLDWVIYLKGENLTDEEARVHTSFLKDRAPLPGRNFALGVRTLF